MKYCNESPHPPLFAARSASATLTVSPAKERFLRKPYRQLFSTSKFTPDFKKKNREWRILSYKKVELNQSKL